MPLNITLPTDHRHLPPDEQGFVYFLQAEGTGLIKIGFSKNPGRRFRNARAFASEPLRLLGLHPGGRRLERKLHRAFRAECSHGEWFHPVPDLLAAVAMCGQKFDEPGDKEFLPAAAITRRLGISESHLRLWVKRGLIDQSGAQGADWYPVQDIEKLIVSQRT